MLIMTRALVHTHIFRQQIFNVIPWASRRHSPTRLVIETAPVEGYVGLQRVSDIIL